MDRFIAERQARWQELAELVTAAGGRTDRLSAAQILALGERYRQAAADLARARQRWPGDPIVGELEALVGRARSLVYRTSGPRGSVREWLTTGMFRRIRERPGPLLVAALLLWGPLVLSTVWAWADPDTASRVAAVSSLSSGAVEAAETGTAGQGAAALDPAQKAELSTVIFINNIRVALTAFAGGMTGGVLTAGTLLLNGAVTGLVLGIFIARGVGPDALSLIAPHGILELSLITAAGAAGLRFGWALVAPGVRPRGEVLATEARAAVEVALGVAVWLIPTGLIEGFVSPRSLPPALALAVGLAAAGTFWALVLVRGRPADQSRAVAFASR